MAGKAMRLGSTEGAMYFQPTAGPGWIRAVALVDTDGNPITVADQIPAAANLLGGYLTAAGTLMTIPAGRTWKGTIYLGNESYNAAGNTGATTATLTITLAGGTYSPATPNLVRIATTAPGMSATSLTPTIDRAVAELSSIVIAADPATACTVALATTVAGAGAALVNTIAMANGVLY